MAVIAPHSRAVGMGLALTAVVMAVALVLVFYGNLQRQRLDCSLPLAPTGGALALASCERLLVVDAAGEVLADHDLRAAGIEDVYHISAHAEGGVLLTDWKNHVVQWCRWRESLHCRDLIVIESNLSQPFVALQWQERIVVSFPEEDKVAVYGADGDFQRWLDFAFSFPHGLSLAGENLLITNTRKQAIVEFNPSLEMTRQMKVDLNGLALQGRKNPIVVEPKGQGDDGFRAILAWRRGQALVDLDSQAVVQQVLWKPQPSDFVTLARWHTGWWVSDERDRELKHFDAQGNFSEHPALLPMNGLLAQERARHRQWTWVSRVAMAVTLCGLALLAWLHRRDRDSLPRLRQTLLPTHLASDAAIKWYSDCFEQGRLGVHSDFVVLRKSGRTAVVRAEELIHSPTALLAGLVLLRSRNAQQGGWPHAVRAQLNPAYRVSESALRHLSSVPLGART